MNQNSEETILIVGAGLVGSLLALHLANTGKKVKVFERRRDPRSADSERGRSINLALAERGIFSLQQAGVMDKVRPALLPMNGRYVHLRDQSSQFQSYSQNQNEKIWSVSRADLNRILVDCAEKTGSVEFFFQSNGTGVDPEKNILEIKNELSGQAKEVHFDALFVADGSNSRLRHHLESSGYTSSKVENLGHSYKEFLMPGASDSSGGFQLREDALHIWPGDDFMMIGLPNPDGSFTMTLFLPNEGPVSLETVGKNSERFTQFFKQWFPDLASLIPDFQRQFDLNPVGSLGTVYCDRWAINQVLLIGDAAHGIVPFHGQGMNCGFEDCTVLMSLLQQGLPVSESFARFEEHRVPDSRAIATMALENYLEMRSQVKDPEFLLRKSVSFMLEEAFPGDFIPRYSMVMFNRMPYREALTRGEWQNQILNRCCEGLKSPDDLDLSLATKLIQRVRGGIH